MEISIKHGTLSKHKTACVIAAVYSPKHLSDGATALDKPSRQALSRLVSRGDINGKVGGALLISNVPGLAAERVLLIGAGKRSGITDAQYVKLVQKAASTVDSAGLKNALSTLTEIVVEERDDAWKMQQQILAFEATAYRFNAFKTRPKPTAPQFSRLSLFVARADSDTATAEARIGTAVVNGLKLTKDLANTPANHCTPLHLAKQAKTLGRRFKTLKINVLNEAAMKKLGMGALLSVAAGSEQPARLITLKYDGARKNQKPVVLVGKGVTFDSGGISIKPGAAMDEMKYDMCGAASVLGVISTIAEAELAVNVVGIIPATENLPDGKASKPGDIVTSMSGQTIEILNTDAEGRLILCDALTYSARFNPAVVIDIATLTGACIVALGRVANGLMSNNDELADDLLAAGECSGDRAWRLPIWDEYQQLIDSPFADMANVGGRFAGSITAACFLARYTEDYRWAHLDIAGTAWRTGTQKGATGRPLALLIQYLRKRIESAA
ncbi:MAG: leucyl aminopeptidase [Proteobacteria bacterium]|nr:MAG: leucyl aminopeptidase [Pseudomonadota bacterium]